MNPDQMPVTGAEESRKRGTEGVTIHNAAEVVRYHRPTEAQVVQHEAVASASENLIRVILENSPKCADQTAAIRKVREAKMTASAAIALEGLV